MQLVINKGFGPQTVAVEGVFVVDGDGDEIAYEWFVSPHEKIPPAHLQVFVLASFEYTSRRQRGKKIKNFFLTSPAQRNP